ncbi:16S rRNA methyltransferase, partial [Clostridium perfringens]
MPNQHYYSNQPEIAHDRKELKTELRWQTFKFISDAGVFSKSGVDYG